MTAIPHFFNLPEDQRNALIGAIQEAGWKPEDVSADDLVLVGKTLSGKKFLRNERGERFLDLVGPGRYAIEEFTLELPHTIPGLG